jgi:hypothetical protein
MINNGTRYRVIDEQALLISKIVIDQGKIIIFVLQVINGYSGQMLAVAAAKSQLRQSGDLDSWSHSLSVGAGAERWLAKERLLANERSHAHTLTKALFQTHTHTQTHTQAHTMHGIRLQHADSLF